MPSRARQLASGTMPDRAYSYRTEYVTQTYEVRNWCSALLLPSAIRLEVVAQSAICARPRIAGQACGSLLHPTPRCAFTSQLGLACELHKARHYERHTHTSLHLIMEWWLGSASISKVAPEQRGSN